VAGVAGEEQAAEAQGLGDEAAQRRDAFLDRRAGDEALRASGGRRGGARPRSARRPLVDLLESGHCSSSGCGAAALAAEREAALWLT